MEKMVSSKWWLGNALTLLMFGIGMIGGVLNVAVGGAYWSAWMTVIFGYGSLVIGYLTIITWYIDVRKIRKSQFDYSPKAWLYALGYIIASPILVSAVYLYNRNQKVGLRY